MKSRRNRYTSFQVLMISLVLIIGTAHPVYASEIIFEEDFENSVLHSNLTLMAMNKTDMRHGLGPLTYFDSGFTREYHDDDHGYTVVAKAIVPPGDGLFAKNDMVAIDNPSTLQFGTWSFDFYLPSENMWWKVFLTESMFSEAIAPYYEEDVCNETLWIMGGANMDCCRYFGFRHLDDPPGSTFDPPKDKVINETKVLWEDLSNFRYQVGSWYRIKMTRTETDFFLSIDDQLVLNTTLSKNLGFEINYFILTTYYGGEVEFDNINFTQPTFGGNGKDDTDAAPIVTTTIIAGISVIAIISTLTYRGLKKNV
ncbi:MAG: hypothetical protein ACW99A_05660 [Candidatus Kariarchaeaceae archaeon]|jgi:hypothetical protein